MADDMTNSSKKATKIIDIESKPSAKPKTMIISHSGLTSNDSSQPSESVDNAPSEEFLTTQHQIVIKPADDFHPDKTADNKEEKDDLTASTTEPVKQAETPPKVDQTDTSSGSDTISESEDHKDDINKATPSPEADAQAEDLEAQKAKKEYDQKIDSLINNKTYFLEIGKISKQRNRLYTWLGLVICIILVIAWLDVALDAGIINNSYHLPHTHFFSVKQ